MQTELQLLQDRHALESGALLNALADSQRTTKLLREENAQLRERLQFLEDKLADAEDRMQQLQYAQSPPPPAAPSRFAYSQRFTSPALSENRTLPTHSRHGSFLRAQPDTRHELSSPEPSSHSPETPEDNSEGFPRAHRKRTSVASSVFAAVPNNMSMIMQEEGTTSDSIGGLSMHSSPPGSPTMVLGRVQPPPIDTKPHPYPRPGHALSKSVSSSAGNISPTTANFSMLTGSPGSLNLRPEHERHLGDMPSLDLADGFEDYDDDAGDL